MVTTKGPGTSNTSRAVTLTMGDENINGPDDGSLVRSAQQGDLDAFSELYERYFSVIYRYIVTRVHDEPTAEDITEQVFLNVFRKIRAYKDRGNLFSTYLYRIARNAIIDYYRKRDESAVLKEIHTGSGEPREMDQYIVRSEQLNLLHQALETLPDDYQEVIRLRILMELPTSTVARWMKRSPGAVRILLHRALKTLKEIVGENSEE